MGAIMQLKYNGEITADMVEIVSDMFYNHIQPEFLVEKPYTSLVFVEVHNDGHIRYASAGHPTPIIFSYEYNKIMKLGSELTGASTPLGVLPSDYNPDIANFDPLPIKKPKLPVNKLHLLSPKDSMILYSDGLSEQQDGERNFVEERLQDVLIETRDMSARDIWKAIRKNLHDFSPVNDDVTVVVVKKT
jgi:serine phosphatase RsbU (regulator of sigma subunit)